MGYDDGDDSAYCREATTHEIEFYYLFYIFLISKYTLDDKNCMINPN